MPDHLYTTDVAEVSRSIAQFGYHLDGIVGYVYSTSLPETVPLFRAFNPTTGDHFYTTDEAEYRRATTQHGYQAEGPAAHVYSPKQAEAESLAARIYGSNQVGRAEGTAVHVYSPTQVGKVTLFRAYNPQTGDHFYTTDEAEYRRAITQEDYQAEGTAAYIYDLATAPEKTIAFYRLWNGS